MRRIGIVEPGHIRIQNAMNIRGINATELAKKTGISSPSISHYTSGRYSPKQDRLVILANALDVTPEYLMGYDVPMEIAEFNKEKAEERTSIYFNKLMALAEEDQSFILKQIDLLSERQTKKGGK